jgi:hypothetical protein
VASSNIKMLGKTGNNEASDECYTPINAIQPLMEFLPKDKTYYECTSSKSSNILDYFKESKYIMVGSETKDYLKEDFNDYDICITNPPYSNKDGFLERAYEIGKPFAFLLPVSAFQGVFRGKLFAKYGLEVLVLNQRPNFTGGSGAHFGVGWFCWKILPQQLIFKNLGV